MGDVFDRIVNRAAAAPGPAHAAALTMRRAPAFEVEPSPVGEEARPGAAEDSAPRLPEPATPATKPSTTVRRDEQEPPPVSGAQAAAPVDVVESPAPRADRRAPDPAGARRDRSARDVRLDHLRPVRTSPESAPAEATPPVALPPERGGAPATAPARAALRARPRPSPTGPAARPPATRTVSAEELLRGHLAPALGDHGALSARDDVRLTAAGLDPVEVPVGGDVHVHLGHVEVVQQAPARPAPEPPRSDGGSPGSTDRVDHADYLARQQRRWS